MIVGLPGPDYPDHAANVSENLFVSVARESGRVRES
jgi:hypothetical protein